MAPLKVFVIILSVVGIVTHINALFLLNSTERGRRIFQREYLTALCITEIWLCVSFSLEATNNPMNRSKLIDIFSIISFAGFSLYQYLLLAFIAIDKFTSIYKPLRYQGLSIKRYTRALIIFGAFVSSSVAVTFLLLHLHNKKDYAKIYQLMSKIIWLPSDMIIFVISIIVYGYFAAVRSKIKQSNACQQLIVSTAIILSFMVFFLIPDLVSVVAVNKYKELYDVFYVMYTLDLVCDALFITFLNRELRTILKRKLCRLNHLITQLS